MIHALLIWDFCYRCSEDTDQELNSQTLETECTQCYTTQRVTWLYATQMMLEDTQ
jgi:hypothetical protein